jgi:ABC-2 type transport system permease protein
MVNNSAVTGNLRLKPRSKYLSLFSISLQRAIAYRQNTLLSIAANLVWVIIPYSIWQRIFETSQQVGSFDWERMQTYILLAYGVNMLISFRVEARIIDTIRRGDIAVELMRPIDYLGAQLAEVCGATVIDGITSLLIVFGLGAFLHISPPATPFLLILFLLSVMLGFLVKFMISYITSLFCFWTLNGLGLLWFRAAITSIFSGALIPIEFLPDFWRTLAHLSPFQTIVHTPIAIYLGEAQGIQLITLLGIQILWFVALWIIARLLWKPSIRKLVVQGG